MIVQVSTTIQEIEPIFVPILFVELEVYQVVQARSVERTPKLSLQFA